MGRYRLTNLRFLRSLYRVECQLVAVAMPVRETFMEPAKDISALLADLPKGVWVALARDQESVIAFDDDLMEALRKSKEAGRLYFVLLESQRLSEDADKTSRKEKPSAPPAASPPAGALAQARLRSPIPPILHDPASHRPDPLWGEPVSCNSRISGTRTPSQSRLGTIQ